MMLTLRQLERFVVLAEELHFGRAAERLHISQPPLSAQIRELETALGVRLLERDSRNVSLTPAGTVFFDRCKKVLRDLEDGVSDAQRASRAEAGDIKIGVIYVSGNLIYRSVLPRMQELYPNIHISVKSMTTAAQLEALHHGEIDLAIVRMPIGDPSAQVAVFSRSELVAMLPASHRLAKRKEIPFAMLAREPQVMFPRYFAPDYYALIESFFQRSGVRMNVVAEADSVYAQFDLIAAGFGVGLVPGFPPFTYNGIVFLPICDDAMLVETGVAYLPQNNTPTVQKFMGVLREVSAMDSAAG